jgi:hypothetical protein
LCVDAKLGCVAAGWGFKCVVTGWDLQCANTGWNVERFRHKMECREMCHHKMECRRVGASSVLAQGGNQSVLTPGMGHTA